MLKWILCATVAFLAQQKKDPDLYYEPKDGISFRKPPKNEEWEFKTEKGKLKDSKLIVAHRVEDISIEFHYADQGKSFDVKKSMEGDFDQISTSESFKEVKSVKWEQARLPGGGAGKVMAWYREMTLKWGGDAPTEWRIWGFTATQNQTFYRIHLICGQGLYEKKKKEIDLILSSVQTWKLPKK
jgi:hypothetical protein